MKIKGLLLIILISFSGIAQVGIGTNTPESSSALDITSTDKGILIPRMTTPQKEGIQSPAEGLQVYDTDTKSVWTFDGTNWKEGVGGGGKFIDGAASDIAFYDGRVGIGRSGFSTIHKLYVEDTTSGSQNTLVKFDAIYDGSGTSAPVYGLGAQARNIGTGTVNYVIGTQGIAINSAAGGTIEIAVGSWPQLSNSSTVDWGAGLVVDNENTAGTMTVARGESINVSNVAGATIGQPTISSLYFNNEGAITGDAYGIWVGGAGNGTVAGNAYGIYIDTPYANVAGNNYAFYSANTANSYFEGNVGYGIAQPLRKVHISEALRLEPQDTPPANGSLGDLYVNSTDNSLYFHDGTQWRQVSLEPLN